MRKRIVVLGLLAAAALSAPGWAEEGLRAMPPGPQLTGVTPEAAQGLIGKLQGAQDDLRQGRAATFALLSGAPAAYREANLSPRQAFLGLSLARPFLITRLSPDGAGRAAYRLEFLPEGPGRIVCDVEVVVGFNGQIERVQLFYGPPPPF